MINMFSSYFHLYLLMTPLILLIGIGKILIVSIEKDRHSYETPFIKLHLNTHRIIIYKLHYYTYVINKSVLPVFDNPSLFLLDNKLE